MDRKDRYDIVLIPSFEPGEKLLEYKRKLNQCGFTHILIVDDGSGERYRSIFKRLEDEGCTVIRHPENLGKGAALKTGFKYIKDNLPGYACVVTADSDGQHAPEDVLKLAGVARCHPDALILGERNFKEGRIPAKSLLGNRIISAIFALLYGKYLPDTQTGLRALGPRLLDQMLNIKGSRFEYELQVLITCIRYRIPLLPVAIRTIYENGNKGTHFKAGRDSLRILKAIASDFLGFAASSIFCSVIDISIAWVLFDFLRPYLAEKDFLRIFFATITARCFSIAANYLINKKFVFKDKQTGLRGPVRYLVLSGVLMLLSAAGVYGLHEMLFFNETISKFLCDTVLFLLSYKVQQRWVFRP